MLSRLFSNSSNSGGQYDSSKPYQPTPRWGHCAVAINGKLYMWGGCMPNLPKIHSSPEKTQYLSVVEVFDPQSLIWEQKPTTGTPPYGVYWSAYTSMDKYMYSFGGYCGHGKCYHNSVHQLDTALYQWRELMVANPGECPMKKWQCGMVAFTQGEDNYLCVFGGWGVLSSSHKNMKYEFVADRANLGCVWSNELHFFNLTKGTWECPTTTGTQPPPCQGFTFTQVDGERVVLHGGFQPGTKRRVNDVYILNLYNKHWIRLYSQVEPSTPWPMGRDDHAACVKIGTCPLLLVVGGVSNQFSTISDLWILDVDSGNWKQISAPQAVMGRRGHSISVFSLAPRHFMLVVYGGISEWLVDKSHREQPVLTETAVVELRESDGGNWKAVCEETSSVTSFSPPGNKLRSYSTSEIDEEPPNVMQNGDAHTITIGKMAPPPNNKPRLGRMSSMTLDRRAATARELEGAKQEIKMLQKQLIEAANVIKTTRKSLSDAELEKKEGQEKIEELQKEQQLIQTKLIDAEEKVRVMEKTCSNQVIQIEELKLQKTPSPMSITPDRCSPLNDKLPLHDLEMLQQLWLVSRDEIQLTPAEISRDVWSSTRVASFRGLHVAARCFKEGTLNEDTLKRYIGSMNLALRARHPNLLQFVGATLGSNPIIVTELMPTTLRMTLRQGPLGKRQVLSLVSDISGALNFLHQWTPQPILHRNVTTSTVLLEPMGNGTWRAKLSDYGSSNFVSSINAIPSSPTFPYTSIYSAPETRTSDIHTTKTDIYSFGVVLLEMCQPTEGTVTSPDLRPRIQRLTWHAMASLIRGCTCTSPHDRLSAAEIIKRLSNSTNESLV